ncbi:MAG: SufE family protein [Rhodobacteraceae bacterium]|nr:SufE family protein [Paracoccaceae bacterium]
MAQIAFEELVETFKFLDDWEDRYRHVIELGKAMPQLDEALKVQATKVDGCASQVWLHCLSQKEDSKLTFSFIGDSDALIVGGLIAILRILYNGLSVESVLEVNAANEMARLGLKDHLSVQRSNGLRAMVERIRSNAKSQIT